MQTVAETPTFRRQAEWLFTDDEKDELIAFLAHNPRAGDIIPDYSLLVYAKNERANLTSDDKRTVSALADAIKAARKVR